MGGLMPLEEKLRHSGIILIGGVPEQLERLDPDGNGLRFIAELQRAHGPNLTEMLEERMMRQKELDEGKLPDFNPATKGIRSDNSWKVGEIPHDIIYRWVELTGPANTPNWVRGALNSGANVWMADYEDALSPFFSNLIANTFYLRDAITRSGDFHPINGQFQLNEQVPTLLTRPRGLHLHEKHMLVDGQPVSATIFDLGMIHYHLTPEQLARGQTPAHYIPKLEHQFESRWLARLLTNIKDERKMPRGRPSVSLLIENIFATFQAAEILYEMRGYATALNVGRWDQTASFYHAFRNHLDRGFPDREEVRMTLPFMIAYQKYVLSVCHARGAQPMGGMEAAVPIRRDQANYERRMQAVRADAIREAELGFYGKWSAHPVTVSAIREEFERIMEGRPNQPYKFGHEPRITQQQLLEVPAGPKTFEGMVSSAEESSEYNGNWVRGRGAVAPKGRMVDLATSEIAWQEIAHRLRHGTRLDDGRRVDQTLVASILGQAASNMITRLGHQAFFEQGHALGLQILADSIRLGPRYVPDIAYQHVGISPK